MQIKNAPFPENSDSGSLGVEPRRSSSVSIANFQRRALTNPTIGGTLQSINEVDDIAIKVVGVRIVAVSIIGEAGGAALISTVELNALLDLDWDHPRKVRGFTGDTNGNFCTVSTACVQTGLGGFFGPIVGPTYTLNGTLQAGASSGSIGVFGEVALLTGLFGSINLGESSDLTLGAGIAPGAAGAAGGIQFCRTTAHRCTK